MRLVYVGSCWYSSFGSNLANSEATTFNQKVCQIIHRHFWRILHKKCVVLLVMSPFFNVLFFLVDNGEWKCFSLFTSSNWCILGSFWVCPKWCHIYIYNYIYIICPKFPLVGWKKRPLLWEKNQLPAPRLFCGRNKRRSPRWDDRWNMVCR